MNMSKSLTWTVASSILLIDPVAVTIEQSSFDIRIVSVLMHGVALAHQMHRCA